MCRVSHRQGRIRADHAGATRHRSPRALVAQVWPRPRRSTVAMRRTCSAMTICPIAGPGRWPFSTNLAPVTSRDEAACTRLSDYAGVNHHAAARRLNRRIEAPPTTRRLPLVGLESTHLADEHFALPARDRMRVGRYSQLAAVPSLGHANPRQTIILPISPGQISTVGAALNYCPLLYRPSVDSRIRTDLPVGYQLEAPFNAVPCPQRSLPRCIFFDGLFSVPIWLSFREQGLGLSPKPIFLLVNVGRFELPPHTSYRPRSTRPALRGPSFLPPSVPSGVLCVARQGRQHGSALLRTYGKSEIFIVTLDSIVDYRVYT